MLNRICQNLVWFVLGAGILIGFGFAVQNATRVPQPPKYIQHSSQPNNESNRACNKDEPSKTFWEKTKCDPTSYFTFWLMVSTAILAASTIALWLVTWYSLKLARSEFVSTHRPKLIVRQFQRDDLLAGHAITVRFSVINIGNTDALPRYLGCEIALCQNGKFVVPPVPDEVVKPINDLPPIRGGQRASLWWQSKFVVTQQQLAALLANQLQIQILGEITYRDALKTQRRTGFRRAHDLAANKFIPSPDPDEEYCD